MHLVGLMRLCSPQSPGVKQIPNLQVLIPPDSPHPTPLTPLNRTHCCPTIVPLLSIASHGGTAVTFVVKGPLHNAVWWLRAAHTSMWLYGPCCHH